MLPFSGIEREMSAEERRATGIDSLSTDELDALNQWLIERFDQVQETVSAEVREEVREEVIEEVREADAAEREAEIERRVAIEVEAAKQEIAEAPPEPEVSEPFEAEIRRSLLGVEWENGIQPSATAKYGGNAVAAITVTRPRGKQSRSRRTFWACGP
jgi:hypothetical protein